MDESLKNWMLCLLEAREMGDETEKGRLEGELETRRTEVGGLDREALTDDEKKLLANFETAYPAEEEMADPDLFGGGGGESEEKPPEEEGEKPPETEGAGAGAVEGGGDAPARDGTSTTAGLAVPAAAAAGAAAATVLLAEDDGKAEDARRALAERRRAEAEKLRIAEARAKALADAEREAKVRAAAGPERKDGDGGKRPEGKPAKKLVTGGDQDDPPTKGGGVDWTTVGIGLALLALLAVLVVNYWPDKKSEPETSATTTEEIAKPVTAEEMQELLKPLVESDVMRKRVAEQEYGLLDEIEKDIPGNWDPSTKSWKPIEVQPAGEQDCLANPNQTGCLIPDSEVNAILGDI